MGRRSYPTVDTMADNLRAIADRLTPEEYAAGECWYPAARAYCESLAESYGITPHQAAGVVAAMSPRQQWRTNKRQACRIVVAYAAGAVAPPPCGFGVGLAQSWAILNGTHPLDALSGPKTRAFYRCLAGDDSAVCVDMWATRAATLGAYDVPRHYADTARAYAIVARERGLSPAAFQAAVWCHIRGGAE